MLEILGYMVVAYGVARLVQTTFDAESKTTIEVVAGVFGIVTLAILAVMLHQQAEKVGGGIGGL